MKKTLILNIIIIFLLILSGSLVSHNDMRNYQKLMDRGNIQEGALIFPSRSQQSIPTVLRKMKDQKIKNFQIYFIQKHNPNISYVYMSQHLTKVPMSNGRYFSFNDFQSPIPFVILGQDLYKNAYKPQSQPYYQLNGNYYTVIGSAGMNSTQKLNQHVFISASPNQNNHTQIRHYQIVVDGNILFHPQLLKKMQHTLRARHPYRSANQINNIKQTWWMRWGITVFGLISLALIIELLFWLIQIPMIKQLKSTPLRGDLFIDFQLGNWFKFFLNETITFLIAVGIVFLKVPIISIKYMSLYFIVLFFLINLIAIIRIIVINKRNEQNNATTE